MRFAFAALAILLMTPQAEAKCWQQKQVQIYKVKVEVVKMLEKIRPAEWKFGSGDELQYVKVLKNKKEVSVTITDWGTLSIDHKSISLSYRLQNRLKRLYKKIACQKVFREVYLMKELLGAI